MEQPVFHLIGSSPPISDIFIRYVSAVASVLNITVLEYPVLTSDRTITNVAPMRTQVFGQSQNIWRWLVNHLSRTPSNDWCRVLSSSSQNISEDFPSKFSAAACRRCFPPYSKNIPLYLSRPPGRTAIRPDLPPLPDLHLSRRVLDTEKLLQNRHVQFFPQRHL